MVKTHHGSFAVLFMMPFVSQIAAIMSQDKYWDACASASTAISFMVTASVTVGVTVRVTGSVTVSVTVSGLYREGRGDRRAQKS